MPHHGFQSLRFALKRVRRRPRLVAAGCGALVVLVVTVTLLGINILQPPPATPTGAPLTLAGTVTDTIALSPTLARTPATHTPTTHAPTSNPVHAPPPPPVPTPPDATPPITFCPTPTPLPAPTATPVPPTATPLPPTATPTGTSTSTASRASQTAAISAACQPCPYYKGNNPSQSQIRAALYQAADQYHLPRNLLLADAWQESKWHEDVISCDGGIGLMQIQYYTYPWLNGVSVPQCGLSPTNYDPYSLQGNANLGAKFFVWLSCFYSYWGDNGGTSPSNPGAYTIAWYYQQAHLNYPDTTNPNGSSNLNSFCGAVFNTPNNAYYAALPSTTAGVWSCPYNAATAQAYCPSYDTNGQPSLLDITLSAYNEGPGYTDQYGIQNCWYVDSVEAYIPQFASGALP
jgi:Transglycosylase SLT domain